MIPVDYWILPGSYLKYGDAIFGLLEKYPKDFPESAERDNFLPPSHRKGLYKDAFGSVWRQEFDGCIGIVAEHPMSDWSALQTYSLPEITGGEITLEQTKNIIARHKTLEKYVCADFIRTFERLHFIRGMEDVMMDIATGSKDMFLFLERIVEWNIAHIKCVLDAAGDDIDGIWFSDDWGMQRSLLISPRKWREVFKPIYKRMFDFVKGSGKAVFLHSDGCITDIIDDLIELGVNALNCQIELMGAELLAERFGGRIAFHTDLDRQSILPFGTTAELRKHIEKIVAALGGYTGGLILNAEFGPDVPLENIRCVFETFDEIRR